MTGISIIIPALDEAANIIATLTPLQPLRAAGHEVILVDGGSQDQTATLAVPLVDQVIQSAPGRARQMNAGASVASGEYLLFLHADTRLPGDAMTQITSGATAMNDWGRFDLRLDGRWAIFRLIERLITLRSRLTGIATGDQAIFIRRELFDRIGGYPDIPLMEDVAISRLLKGHARPRCLRGPVLTSSRRWEQRGVFKTILLMWSLRLRYALGASPSDLARRYE